MKNIITIISFNLIYCACFAQGNENNLSNSHLAGGVKEVTDHYFENIDRVDTLKPHTKEILRFNTKGNEIEGIFCDTDRMMMSFFAYNEKGENTEVMEYDTGKTDTLKSILKYNNKGHLIEKEDLMASDSTTQIRSRYSYDNQGQLVEVDLYHKDKPDDIASKVFFKYDEKGNRIEKDIFLSRFGLFGKNIYHYNSQGLEVYSASYNGAGRLSDEIKSEYSDFDNHGNWTMESITENIPGDATKKTIVKRVIVYY